MPAKGQICRGNELPFGTLPNDPSELRNVYYYHGHRRDEDVPAVEPWGLRSDYVLDADEQLERVDLARKLVKWTPLTKREQAVIALHLYEGFDFAVIGRAMELTRERVRQIYERAMEKLREQARCIETADGLASMQCRWRAAAARYS